MWPSHSHMYKIKRMFTGASGTPQPHCHCQCRLPHLSGVIKHCFYPSATKIAHILSIKEFNKTLITSSKNLFSEMVSDSIKRVYHSIALSSELNARSWNGKRETSSKSCPNPYHAEYRYFAFGNYEKQYYPVSRSSVVAFSRTRKNRMKTTGGYGGGGGGTLYSIQR